MIYFYITLIFGDNLGFSKALLKSQFRHRDISSLRPQKTLDNEKKKDCVACVKDAGDAVHFNMKTFGPLYLASHKYHPSATAFDLAAYLLGSKKVYIAYLTVQLIRAGLEISWREVFPIAIAFQFRDRRNR